MRGLRIQDKKPGGGLGFDLRDILAALGDEVVKAASWKVSIEQCIIRGDSPWAAQAKFLLPVGGRFASFSCARRPGTVAELHGFAAEVGQVVDGEFTGYKITPQGKRAWVIIKAFDSAWWEVFATDERLLLKINAAFQNTTETTLIIPLKK